jgi:putative ABC transport system permease protein
MLRRSFPGVTVATGAELQDGVLVAQDSQLAPFRLIRHVAVVMTAVMVLNTMMLAVFQREREIGLLRAIGMSRGGLALSLFLEAGLLLLLAGTAGLVFGGFFQSLGISFIAAATGLPLRWSLEWQPLLEGLLAALVAAGAGAAYPAWRACRLPIVQAISYE